MSDTGSDEAHGTYGGTERGDTRGAEEPDAESEADAAEWAEKTDRGGEATS